MYVAWLPLAAAGPFDARHPWTISSSVGQLGPVCIPRPPPCGSNSGLLFGKLQKFKADIVQLRAEFEAIAATTTSPATSYTKGVKGYEGWALLSSDGSVSDGVSYLKSKNKDPYRSPTPALRVGGAFHDLLQDLDAMNLRPARVRLMSLSRDFQEGNGMEWHRDGGVRWRVHIPIFTTPDAVMEWQADWDFDPIQSHHRLHMPANGSAWATRVDLMHRAVVSPGSTPAVQRVHLIMDVDSRQLKLEDAHPVCSCGEDWKVQADAPNTEMCQDLPRVSINLQNTDVSPPLSRSTGLMCQSGMSHIQQGQLRAHIEFATPGRWTSKLRQVWYGPTGANWTKSLDVQLGKQQAQAILGTEEEPPAPGPWRLITALGSAVLAEATFIVLPQDVKSNRQTMESSLQESGYIDLDAPLGLFAMNASFQWRSDWQCTLDSIDNPEAQAYLETHRALPRSFTSQSAILLASEAQSLCEIMPIRDSLVANVAKLPEQIGISPCIAAARTGVAASSSGTIYAFSLQTGQILWHTLLGQFIGNSLFCARGHGIVYASYISESGWSGIAALKLDDGHIVWQDEPHMLRKQSSTLTVDEKAGILLAVARDGCVLAYIASSGLPLWNHCIAAGAHTSILKIRTALGVAVFAASDGTLYGVATRDGRVRWHIPSLALRLTCQPALSPASLGLLGRAAPVVFAVTWDGIVVAMDILTGEWLWQRQLFRRLQGNLVVVSQRKQPTMVFVRTAGGQWYGIDAESGKVLWTSPKQTPRPISQ